MNDERVLVSKWPPRRDDVCFSGQLSEQPRRHHRLGFRRIEAPMSQISQDVDLSKCGVVESVSDKIHPVLIKATGDARSQSNTSWIR